MGYKPVPTKLFRKWLRYRGLVYKRTKGSHEIWDYPNDSLLRPVVFRGAEKDIPGAHIHTNLSTLNVSYETFVKELQQV